jgi:AcrR family transcriptional regulator
VTKASAAAASTAGRGEGAADTRQRLLDVAAEVFAERGYEGARVQEIARRAGMTTGAIYGNFAHKSALLMAVIDLAGKQAMRALPALDPEVRPADLMNLWAGRLAVPATNRIRMLFVEVLTAARREEEARTQVVSGLLRTRRDVAAMVKQARARQQVRPDVDGDSLGHFMLALTLGSYLLEAAGVPLPDEKRWSQLIAIVTESLSTPPAPSS